MANSQKATSWAARRLEGLEAPQRPSILAFQHPSFRGLRLTLSAERGIALVVVIAMMVILLSITGAALLFSGLSLKSAANLKTGSGAIHVADASIQHALAIIPVGTDFDTLLAGGVTEFPCKNQSGTTGTCDGTNFKPTLTGSLSGYTYTVVAENDVTVSGETATNDVNHVVILTSTATGSNGATRKIKAYIGRSTVYIPPGPVYLPGSSQFIDTRFTGTSFEINGNDTIPGQSPGSGSASPIPGITTSTTSLTTAISGAGGTLDSSQYAEVNGLGGSPSVNTTSSLYQFDVNQLAQDIISAGIEGVTMQTLSTPNNTSGVWGTELAPKITHLTANNAQLGGTLTGYGVLIADANLAVRGSFSFKGIIIVLGEADFKGSGDAGTATLWGGLFVRESTSSDVGKEFEIGGAAKIYYSSQTLSVINNNWGNNLPKAAKLTAWHELML